MTQQLLYTTVQYKYFLSQFLFQKIPSSVSMEVPETHKTREKQFNPDISEINTFYERVIKDHHHNISLIITSPSL